MQNKKKTQAQPSRTQTQGSHPEPNITPDAYSTENLFGSKKKRQ